VTDAKRDFTKPQRFGYVDAHGIMAIPPDFRFATGFSEGLAAVRINDERRYGYIDRAGRLAIPPIACDLAGPFSGGLAAMQRGDQIGYIDSGGRFVWPLK
jgi:hypothetical protein